MSNFEFLNFTLLFGFVALWATGYRLQVVLNTPNFSNITRMTTASKKSGKSTAPKRKTQAACKSFLDKVVFSIRALQDHNGSSRQSIAKFIRATWDADNKVALRKALKKGEESGILERTKQSFRVSADGAYARAPGSFVEVVDERLGEGEPAAAGDEVVVSYRGTLAATGEVFDSAKSFRFTLAAGDVIKGWDEGISGMRAGGKRMLVVPPKLGYGKKGSGRRGEKGWIPPDATLRFLVKLKQIL
jgi:FKBP-type peptidyl-prolyl cis-trans isomerase